MEEIWKVSQTNERYEVSNFGNIRNAKAKRVLKANKQPKYSCVSYSSPNGTKVVMVRQEVALCFVENPQPKKFHSVRNIDGDPYNCAADNLEWYPGGRSTFVTDEIRDAIIDDINNGLKGTEIAIKYNVSRALVSRLKHGNY